MKASVTRWFALVFMAALAASGCMMEVGDGEDVPDEEEDVLGDEPFAGTGIAGDTNANGYIDRGTEVGRFDSTGTLGARCQSGSSPWGWDTRTARFYQLDGWPGYMCWSSTCVPRDGKTWSHDHLDATYFNFSIENYPEPPCCAGLVPVAVDGWQPLFCKPKCSLSVSKTYLARGEAATWNIVSNPQGLRAYWYGTYNGVVDVAGAYAGITNHSQTGSAASGTYTRYAKVYDASGRLYCTTRTITVAWGQ